MRLAARLAVAAVLLPAAPAVRRVVVAARFAVVVVRLADFRADVAVPFAPVVAARAVLVAPDRALRPVLFAPDFADVAEALVVRAARSAVSCAERFALLTASMAVSVTDAAAARTVVAVVRDTFEPVGDTDGRFLRRISATRSPTAVTPP